MHPSFSHKSILLQVYTLFLASVLNVDMHAVMYQRRFLSSASTRKSSLVSAWWIREKNECSKCTVMASRTQVTLAVLLLGGDSAQEGPENYRETETL